jgi:thioredoxin 1
MRRVMGALVGLLVVLCLGACAPGPDVDQPSHIRELQAGEDLSAVITGHPVVVVDFYADWCGPCKRLKPRLNELALSYKDRVVFVGVNVDAHRDVAMEREIRSIPDVRVYADGQLQEILVGMQPKERYAAILDRLLGTSAEGDTS